MDATPAISTATATPDPRAAATDDPSPELAGVTDDGSPTTGDDPGDGPIDGGELEPTRPPLVDDDGRVRLSFSRIDTYQQCSLRFRYRYVDNLPGKTATYLSFGTSVHAALELFHERTLFGMPSEEDLLGFLYDHWDSSGYAAVSRERQVDDYRRAQHTLQRYFRRMADDYRPAADTEKWFELPVGDEALVVGSIDRVDVDDDGQLHVVDYKTGRLRDREKVRGSLQLAIYALACEHLYGRLPASVALDYVVADIEVRVPVDELDLDGAKDAIRAAARGVIAGEWEPTPTRLCDWCDHQSVCPAWEGDGEAYGAAVVERDRLRRQVRRSLHQLRALEAGVDRLADELAERGLDPVLTTDGDVLPARAPDDGHGPARATDDGRAATDARPGDDSGGEPGDDSGQADGVAAVVGSATAPG